MDGKWSLDSDAMRYAGTLTRERRQPIRYSAPGYDFAVTINQDGRVLIEVSPDPELGYPKPALHGLIDALGWEPQP